MYFSVKILVFVVFATAASYVPFFSLFMLDKGYDALDLGTLQSFSRVIMVVTTPIASAYADKHRVHRELLSVMANVAAVTMVLFYLSPSGSLVYAVALLGIYSCCSGAKMAIVDSLVLAACRGGELPYAMQRLWGSIAYGTVAISIGLVLRGFGDWSQATKERLGGEHVVAGPGPAGVVRYDSVPLIHAGFMVALAVVLLCCFRLPRPQQRRSRGYVSVATQQSGNEEMKGLKSQPQEASEAAKPRLSSYETYQRLLADPRVLFPIPFGVCLIGIAESSLNTFLFPYLRVKMNAPPILFSMILALHAVVEVCCFTFGSHVVQSVGPATMLIVSCCAFAVKAFAYATLSSPWGILLVELLHGFCFAFMWTASVGHIERCAALILPDSDDDADVTAVDDLDDQAPRSSQHLSRASYAMTTLWFFYGGVPSILAGVMSGAIVHYASEVVLFRLVGVFCLAVAGLFVLYDRRGLIQRPLPTDSSDQRK